MNFFLAEKLTDDLHIEFQDETEVRDDFTGFDHVADDGQIERREQVVRPVDDKSRPAESRRACGLARRPRDSARRLPRWREPSVRSCGSATSPGRRCTQFLLRADGKEAILRAESFRGVPWRTISTDGVAFLLAFFMVLDFLVLPLE